MGDVGDAFALGLANRKLVAFVTDPADRRLYVLEAIGNRGGYWNTLVAGIQLKSLGALAAVLFAVVEVAAEFLPGLDVGDTLVVPGVDSEPLFARQTDSFEVVQLAVIYNHRETPSVKSF